MESSETTLVSSSDNPESSVTETTQESEETILLKAARYLNNLAQFVRLFLGLMMDERVDKKMKIFVGAVLAYIFAPLDFIPDFFGGLFGVLDDFVLSAFAVNVILNWTDPEIVKSHWRGEKDLLETVRKAMKNAELLVPEAIIKKIQIWVGRHAEKAEAKSAKASTKTRRTTRKKKVTRKKKTESPIE